MNNKSVRKVLGAFFMLSVIIFVFGGVIFLLDHQKHLSLISPTLANSRLSISDNVWFPKYSTNSADPKIDITAQAAFFVEGKSGEVLYEKSARERLPVASLVKIMTAVVALEGKQVGDLVEISDRAAGFEPDKMYLLAGEHFSVEELLTGIFMVSGNDAAEALAESLTGRREEFINLMNSKSKQLGMFDSHFINPTGLQEDGVYQYSSAYDVALMSRYLIKRWPDVLRLSSIPYVFWPKNERRYQDYEMYSGINLLTSYPGVVGLKTGFTPEAGLTLVTVAQRGDKQVIGVLLGATNRRDDAKKLLDYSFARLDEGNL